MLSKLIYEIENTNQAVHYNNASLFQGFLMEQIDTDYATILHQSELKPYSQSLTVSPDKVQWEINTLHDESFRNINQVLAEKNLQNIHLSYNDTTLPVLKQTLTLQDEDEWIKQMFVQKSERFISLSFATPTAFKQAGHYVFYPDTRLIFQSLLHRFDRFHSDAQLYSEDVLLDLVQYTEISQYRLKSCNFALEGVRIPAFLGDITLKVNGPQQLVNLVHLLVDYASYAGVGVKTAIGMGSVKKVERKKKHG